MDHFTDYNKFIRERRINDSYRSLGDFLKKILRKTKAFKLLDSHCELDGCGFTSGGCCVLGDALKILFPNRELAVVKNKLGIPQHIILKISENMFYDGEGLSTERQMLISMIEEGVQEPYIDKFDRTEIKELSPSFIFDPKLSQDIANYILSEIKKDTVASHHYEQVANL